MGVFIFIVQQYYRTVVISFCRGERLFMMLLTICTHRRQCLLGAMVDGRKVILSSIGRIVYEHVICSEKELNRIRDYIE